MLCNCVVHTVLHVCGSVEQHMMRYVLVTDVAMLSVFVIECYLLPAAQLLALLEGAVCLNPSSVLIFGTLPSQPSSAQFS